MQINKLFIRRLRQKRCGYYGGCDDYREYANFVLSIALISCNLCNIVLVWTKQSIILRYMAWCDDSGGNNSKIVNTTYSGCPFPVDEIQHLTESIVDEQIALCCTKRPASNNAFAQSRSTNDAK